MDRFDTGVMIILLVAFIYGCMQALWIHELAGAILCGGLAVLDIMSFINLHRREQERKMRFQSSEQRLMKKRSDPGKPRKGV